MDPSFDATDYALDFLRATPSVERCAVILADRSVVEVSNDHVTPHKNFQVGMQEVILATEGKVERVVAMVHTHSLGLDPDPTSEDIAGIPSNVYGVVVHCETGTLVVYDFTGIQQVHLRKRKIPKL